MYCESDELNMLATVVRDSIFFVDNKVLKNGFTKTNNWFFFNSKGKRDNLKNS